MRIQTIFLTTCVLLLLSILSAEAATNDGYDYYREWAAKNLKGDAKEVPGEVQGKLDEFLQGVKKAWEEEHAAKSHKDVVDLGQSLHLLESKFSNLKDTIFKQFIDTKGSSGSTNVDTKQIENAVSTIVSNIVDQQGNVGQIQVDADKLEKTVKKLLENLQRLEGDISKATKMMEKLDSAQEEVRTYADKHYDSLTSHGDNIEDLALANASGHRNFYILIVIEMIALAIFAYFRRWKAKKNKYDKMG